MTRKLTHPPAQIIRQLLIDLDQGTNPEASGEWPIYAVEMPDSPSDVVFVSDTEGRTFGRYHPTGETVEKYGIQFLFRSEGLYGYLKAADISSAVDVYVRRNEVHMDEDEDYPEADYMVNAVHKIGPIVRIGKEPDSGGRWLWSLNCIASIEPITESLSGILPQEPFDSTSQFLEGPEADEIS
jgi:hypothetical protein